MIPERRLSHATKSIRTTKLADRRDHELKQPLNSVHYPARFVQGGGKRRSWGGARRVKQADGIGRDD